MSREPQSPDADRLDPLVVHARRETLLILIVFAICLVWSVTWCYLTGYPDITLEQKLGGALFISVVESQ